MARRSASLKATFGPEYNLYRKRLRYILLDEDYGPKLVRLNKTDQQKVLELIYQNQGKTARSEIFRLDAERIARQKQYRNAHSITAYRKKAATHVFLTTHGIVDNINEDRRFTDIMNRYANATKTDCELILTYDLPAIRSAASAQIEGNLAWYK